MSEKVEVDDAEYEQYADQKRAVVEDEEEHDTQFDQAVELEKKNPQQAVPLYLAIITRDDPKNAIVKVKEQAIYHLGKVYAKLGQADDLKRLLVTIRPFFGSIPKGKTAKIVRSLIDLVGEIPNAANVQAELCKELIEWCIQEKRSFLRQRIQARLANLYMQMKEYKEALRLIGRLTREVKKIDDKLLLVETHLIESRVHHALQNLPKSKGALTAARSNANSIYCPPLLQAEIDQQAGILCSSEKDYKTAFSYFFEAFEGYNTANLPECAVRCLKYMLMAKIMLNISSDVYAIINGKAGVRYAGIDIEAMKATADAHKERSIHSFEAVLKKYKAQLVDDPFIFSHLNVLYENLLEQNLIRLIEPFSRVQISHVAKLINLPLEQVESKLSEMILDQKIHGILDQGAGDLIIFEEGSSNKTYETSIETIRELGSVVDKLYNKAKTIQS